MTSHLIKKGCFQLTAVGLACLALTASLTTATAAPLALATAPAGNGGQQPAPNVIITVDDSGSMDWRLSDDSSYRVKTADKKITLLKNSLLAQFGDGNANPPTKGKVPDGRIRLAWQAMHNNGGAPGADSLTLGATNSMKPFTGTHRANFSNFVNSLSANQSTPSHKMMVNAYNYMRSPAGTDSPWANTPGTAQTTPYLACRRTYHIFMTDGAWNSDSNQSVGNADGTSSTLGNGTTLYDPGSSTIGDQFKVYKDTYGGNSNQPSTLSDFAFKAWATDLQDGGNSTQNMANSVVPLIKKIGSEAITNSANTKTVSLQEYWNPKNDPATWQHINQYTIGFGLGAVTWDKIRPDWDDVSNSTYGGDYPNIVTGDVLWPDVKTNDSGTPDIRSVELWHMAINGRGRYYPAKTADSLTAAFADILDTVIADTSIPLVSIATSSSYLSTGLNAYIAGYSAATYSGSLAARPIDGTTGAIAANEAWNAGTLLDDISAANISNRLVLSYDGSSGISWATYSLLPTLQQTPLNKNSTGTVDSNGQNRVDYIRGDRSKEASQSGGIFRTRKSRLGDIVNSNIWYTGKPASGYNMPGYATFRSTGTGGKGGRTSMIYVGANDGMLHGFAAGTGVEKLAYIPQGIAQGDLRKLTDANYIHQYFVDGSPFTGDAFIGTTPAWATVLVGTLGAGGKGYFVLNVTDPADFTATNAASLVVADTTATSDADIGVIVSPPVVEDSIANKSRQIVKMNGNRWAAVLGNGYNSTNEAPVLLVQYLDGDKAIKKVSPCSLPTSGACAFKGSNGLSAPQLIDLNGDGTVDVAYAGDLKGNVWKFNLTSSTDSNWSVAFSGQPIFVAKPSATVTQPITTAPFWMQHPMGGIMLAVGTGQNLTVADQSSTSTDSVYALYDNSTFTIAAGTVTITDSTAINTTSSTSIPSTLVQQTITGTLSDAGITYYTSSSNPVNYGGGSPKRGWYLNWSIGGQRLLQNIRAFTGQKILVQSMIPKSGGSSSDAESCSLSATTERSFQSVFNMFTGNPSQLPVFTMTVTGTPNQNVTTVESITGDTSIIRTPEKVKLLSSNCPAGQVCNSTDFNPGKFVGIRASWREMQ